MSADVQILVIQNMAAAPPGVIGEALASAGASVVVADMIGGGPPATIDPDQFDGLIVLGGTMRCDDEGDFPRMVDVLQLIQGFHAAKRPYLGICLGAQLLARALGMPPRPRLGWEVGFTELQLTPDGRTDRVFGSLPERCRFMELHEDSFFLPDGASLLMSGTQYTNQAYRVGATSYGVQFHPEVNRSILDGWCALLAERAPAAEASSKIEKIRSGIDESLDAHQTNARLIANHWLALVRECARSRLANA